MTETLVFMEAPGLLRESIAANLLTEDRWKLMLGGLDVTLRVSLLSLVFATLLGALLCAMRMSRSRAVSGTAKAYIGLMRSLPLLLLLLVLFYLVLASSGLSAIQIAIVCFSLYFGAYFSEIFRTGIEGVSKGQREAGAALGMSRAQVFRKVVLPQALLRILPVFKNQLVTLIKATSIIGYVAIMDLTKASDVIRSRTFDAFFPLLLTALIYLILSWLSGLAVDALEKRLTPKHSAS
ncbi:MAG: amino acid ABC transporter permease [Bacteroidales bacterium]|nr:amino acid ABC transporter permease [Bacteroidales bacterium]